MTTNVAGAIVSVKLALALCAGDPESVTFSVKLTPVAAAVGVPLISPVDEFSAKPAGSAPDVSVHAYGGVPFVAVKLCEYASPTCPFGRDAVVIVSVAGVMVSVRPTSVFCAGELESVT